MEVLISTGAAVLNATQSYIPSADNWVLFLSGGSLDVGRERYKKWQEQLLNKNINSLSFDYSGVHMSGSALEDSSLASRIHEAKAVVEYIKSKSKDSTITVFGSSMGGYIALGLVSIQPDVINKVAIFAPAAYAKSAHQLYFDGSFTTEIRKEKSWKQSYSYAWLEKINVPVLFIEPDTDLIVPQGVYEKYREIGSKKSNFEFFGIAGPHNCWDQTSHQDVRRVLLQKLVDFVVNK